MNYTDRAKRYIALCDEIDVLAAQLKQRTTERDDLEEQLLEDFIDAGRQRDTLGGRTLYLRRDTYCSAVKDENGTYDGAIRALRAHGLDDVIRTRPDASTLRSWILHERKLGQEVPDDLAPYLKITDRWRILATARKETAA